MSLDTFKFTDWQQRVIEEKHDLAEKMDRLLKFMESPSFYGLGAHEQHLLNDQYRAMAEYFNILGKRIEIF